MAYTVPTIEPSTLRAGDTWQWRRDNLSDYPAPDWSLIYYFRNASDKFDVTAATDGSNFVITVAKTVSLNYPAGYYDWIGVVESSTERHQIGAGRLNLLPNLASDIAIDARSFAQRMLDMIEAALLNRASSDQLDLIRAEMDGRMLIRGQEGLTQLRNIYRLEVQAEQRSSSGKRHNRILCIG